MSPYRRLRYLILPVLAVSAISSIGVSHADEKPLDEVSGFVIDDGWELTNAHCASCHSAKLVTQNRMDRDGWQETIRLMQAEHGLWDLGGAEPVIIEYLDLHYSPDESRSGVRKGRLLNE